MKKTKSQTDQPMGIVIATGQAAPKAPRVRAYFWCETEAPTKSPEEVEQ